MHAKFHTLLVDRLTNPLDKDQQQILLATLERIARFVNEQYKHYTDPAETATEVKSKNNQVRAITGGQENA